LTETRNSADDEFGADRLLAALQDRDGLTAEDLVTRLTDARRAFAAGDERDDVTVLVAQAHDATADERRAARVDPMVALRCE